MEEEERAERQFVRGPALLRAMRVMVLEAALTEETVKGLRVNSKM